MAPPKRVDVPELGFFEKADIPLVQFSTALSALFAALTGIFRGKSSPRYYSHHIKTAAIRSFTSRISHRQQKHSFSSFPEAYESVMKKRGLDPAVVPLPNDTEGYWLGNKDAKNVVVYYHGGGFSMAPVPPHFEFWLDLLEIVNRDGHDIAVFFPRYTLTPFAAYPTQLRQAIGALRYILSEGGRDPSNVIVGGDSAGGNLSMATLLHLTHPHPDIEPIDLTRPLAGVFGFAPWVGFGLDYPSMKGNAYKDIIPIATLKSWSKSYLDGKEGDNWSEPLKAPVEWWADAQAKTERILILAGSDEILLSPIEEFAKKVKSVFPNTTYIVGVDESHDAHLYVDAGNQTQTGRDLRQWIASRL